MSTLILTVGVGGEGGTLGGGTHGHKMLESGEIPGTVGPLAIGMGAGSFPCC